MKVEQAIYGEVRGGHALRLASDRGRTPAELALRLDLPDTAPSGLEWSPTQRAERSSSVFAEKGSGPSES